MPYLRLHIPAMDGVPWEFEQLPRGQHPNAVGDIFASPPVRKQGTRKSPKDIKLDTIVERPSGPASSQKSPEHLRRDASEPCLFIIFDKQAGWLRLADSTVGVMTLAAVGGLPPPIEDPKSKWALPVRFELPIPGQMNEKQFVYILTRGFRTHIVSYPSPPSPPLAAACRLLEFYSHLCQSTARPTEGQSTKCSTLTPASCILFIWHRNPGNGFIVPRQ